MKHYIISLITLFIFVACGNENETTSQIQQQKSPHFSVQRAPSDTLLFEIEQKIRLEFSSPLDIATVTSDSVYLEKIEEADAVVSRVGAYSGVTEGTNRLYLTPHEYLLPESTYQLVVTTDVKDIYGRSMQENFIDRFTTANATIDSSEVLLRAEKPSDGADDVLVNSEILLDFNKNLASTPAYSNENYFVVTDADGVAIAGRVDVFNNLLKFIPQQKLPYDTEIHVQLQHSISDLYGNIYSDTPSWSFKTRSEANSPKSSLGYKVIESLKTDKNSYVVRKIYDAASYSLLAVARDGGVDIYRVEYGTPATKPTLHLTSSYAINAKISSMVLAPIEDGVTLLVATRYDGFYHLRLDTTADTLTLLQHYDSGKDVYKIAIGKTNYYELYPDRVYSVTPIDGLKIYDFNATTAAISFKNEINSSIVGRSIDVLDQVHPDENGDDERTLYVANYDGKVVVINEANISDIIEVELNASVKMLSYFVESAATTTAIYAIGSSGNIEALEFNGVVKTDTQHGLHSSVNDIALSMNMYGFQAQHYYATENGIALLDANSSYIQHYINEDKAIASLDFFSSYNPEGSISEMPSLFLISLSKSGDLEIYNALFYDLHPTATIGIPNSVDESFYIEFMDAYFDHATVSESEFSLVDNNDSSLTPLGFTLQKDAYMPMVYLLKPDANLTSGDEYTLTIKADKIKNMLGSPFNKGVDYNRTFIME